MSDALKQATDLALGDRPSPNRHGSPVRAIRSRTFPLSSAQQRLWVLEQLEPGNPASNVSAVLRLTGLLDVNALQQALNQVVRRHDALRTTAHVVDGQPVQVVAPAMTITLATVDLQTQPEETRAAAVDSLIAKETRRGFSLFVEPLFRALLIRLDPREHILCLTKHRFVADLWSVGVIIREIAALYDAAANLRSSPLLESFTSYGDFAARQREWLRGPDARRQLGYWRHRLASLPPALELPTDRPRAAVQHFDGARHVFNMPIDLTHALNRLSREEGVLLATTLLAAFQVLLQRYTGQEDIPVGVPVPNRARLEMEGAVGFFENLLVLRADLSGDPTFRTLLGQVRDVSREGYAHPDLPFEKLVEELQPHTELSRNPLVQMLFTFHATPLPTPRVAGVTFTPLAIDGDAVPCDVSLEMVHTSAGLTGRLKYNRNLFEASSIARVADHYQSLLECVAANPDRPLSELTLMDTTERRRMLVEWNSTRVMYPPATCLHRLVEAAAARAPDETAVVLGSRHVTYRELNRRANQLARHLRGLGVEPGQLVAICLERSAELPVGLLGILKSGGAYVPIDPDIPPERRRFILEDSRARVILTQKKLAASLPQAHAQAVCLDADWEAISRHGVEDLPDGANPDQLAYVIYTSGSTGRPKGVLIPHRSIYNTLRWRLQAFPMGPQDRVLHTLAFDFDASVCGTFAPLAGGARLYLMEPGAHRDPGRIVQLVTEEKITHILQPTSMLRILLEQRGIERAQSLRHFFCGGEVLTVETQNRFFERFPNAELTNLYGPTEVSVEASSWTCRRGHPVVPIGKPLANAQVYVLDARRQPVPVGVPGELYVGGAGLAWGYLNMPSLTAEKFVPNPFHSQPGARLYRTGDLCRWLPDGTLDFLGRVDHQVKIRGVRIEPGEVEAVVGRYPAVREAIVLAREYAPGEKRLVAYVVPQQRGAAIEGELRRYLKATLPEYMVPSAFVVMDAFPRSPNGKLDLKSLPAPGQPSAEDRPYEAPRTALEQYLCQTWQEILGVGRIGRSDHFFDLGGHSIQSAVLIHKLQEKLSEFVYTVAVYDAPSVEQLARYLSENYPDAVERVFGTESLVATATDNGLIDESKVSQLRKVIRTLPARTVPNGPKNPPAVFILSPPRSGSTLSRVMLGGHPRLFAPPELQLLNFNTLAERKAVLSTERDRFWLDGTVRALMEIKRCDAEEAKAIMEDCEKRGLTVKEFYRLMQDWLGDSIFVEKTPTYALDVAMLRRAEEDFENVRYIHLIRHPNAMIASFEEARLHVFFPPFFTGEHPFTARQLAELIWVVNHQNILQFLANIPAKRQCRVYFEDLVTKPEQVMADVARFLDLEFHPHMADPYKQSEKSRMTDAIHPMARMLGDVKFHKHTGVDARAAERGREPSKVPLGSVTRNLARELGYDMTGEDRRAEEYLQTCSIAPVRADSPADGRETLVPIQPKGALPPLYCVHPAGGTVYCYTTLARHLGPDQPFYGLQARGLNGEHPPHDKLEDMAAHYVAAIRSIQPHGPYRLGGWSIGGITAYEMARQLENAGDRVDLIVLFDSHFPEKNPPELDPVTFLIEFALHSGLDIRAEQIVSLPYEQQLGLVLDKAKQSGVFSADANLAEFGKVFRNYSRVFEANIRATRKYEPRPAPGRLVLFRAADIAASVAYEPRMHWRDLASTVEVHDVPGDHYTILREPQVKTLAKSLQAILHAGTSLNGKYEKDGVVLH
jgi:amino acid adenylation domain-containing protein